MIRDGLDAQPVGGCKHLCRNCATACLHLVRDAQARALGWQPIATAPIAQLDVSLSKGGFARFSTAPAVIEGLTTHGAIVIARYRADGDYQDRWSNGRGNITYHLTHWREAPLGAFA